MSINRMQSGAGKAGAADAERYALRAMN